VRGAAGMSLKLAGTGIEETWGGDGNDTFDGTGDPDVLKLRGGAGGDKLTGGSAGDTLFGGDGDDALSGGPGDDILKGEAGTDTLTGGPGADFFNYAKFDGSTDTVTDYSFADGDTVNAASFAVHGKDTWLLDADGKTLLVLKDYNGETQGIAPHK
jgi:Ca2+-binding RTX toxin-like protein